MDRCGDPPRVGVSASDTNRSSRNVAEKKTAPLRAVLSEADGTRTRNHRIDSQRGECPNPRQHADLRAILPSPAAPGAAPGAESPPPPDLAAVIAAWPALAPAVRAGIAAMVQASAVR